MKSIQMKSIAEKNVQKKQFVVFSSSYKFLIDNEFDGEKFK